MDQGKDIFVNDEFLLRSRIQTGWGLPIACYFFFSGTGAGLFLCSLILQSSLGILIDLLFLGIGVIVLFFDLGSRWRFWKAFKKPTTSWISRGTFLITGLFLFDLTYALTGFAPLALPISFFFGAIAVMVILYPGLVISYSPSIALWNSPFIPVLFGLHSITSGVSITLILHPPAGGIWREMVLLEVGLLFFLLIGTGIFLVVSYASTIGARKSVQLLLGRWGISSLFTAIVLGILIPLGLFISLTAGLSLSSIILLACILRLFGDFGFRYAILKVGLYDPLM